MTISLREYRPKAGHENLKILLVNEKSLPQYLKKLRQTATIFSFEMKRSIIISLFLLTSSQEWRKLHLSNDTKQGNTAQATITR